MPIYEFYSPNTNKIYSFYSRSLKNADASPSCPDGKKFEMRKMISAFSVTGKEEGDNEKADELKDGECDDPLSKLSDAQSSQIMQEMERAMSGIDDENPDPRQMGSLMRKMSDMTGEKMDGVMEEVVRKLEEGMNPDELEEKLGNSMEETVENGEIKKTAEEILSKHNNMKMRLTRDTELYEFEDYLS